MQRKCEVENKMPKIERIDKLIKLNFRHASKDSHYMARCVWQELFRIYRGKGYNIENLDNLLCDMHSLERMFKVVKQNKLYWEGDKSGYTTISACKEMVDAEVLIEYDGGYLVLVKIF